jgi:putative transposase
MARRPRLALPGVPLHVIQRGNNRNPCFVGDGDRRLYLQCLAEAAGKHRCAIHAYVLMPNHVHLLTTPADGDGVSLMMQEVGRRYVRLFNDTYKRTGTLWEGRFKAVMIDSERYFLTCQRYVELNPVRATLVSKPSDYTWSSHRHNAVGVRNALVTPHEIFTSLAQDDAARRTAYVALFAQPMPVEEIERIREATNKGWPLGSESFVKQVESALGRPARPPKRGRKPGNSEESADLADRPGMLI